MHELGIVFNIVETVESFAAENDLTQVAAITLQVGEFSPVIPAFLEECYPAAVDKSVLLHDTKLKIEVIPATCLCGGCGKVFAVTENKNACPSCGAAGSELVTGREFQIKEIEAC